jgi:uncharacterized protein (TIGR00251 family)
MAESILAITVKPRAAKNAAVRTPEGVLVRVTAPPAEGAANAAVVETLAKALGVPKSRLTIVAGATGRVKRVRVEGLTADELAARVAALSPGCEP